MLIVFTVILSAQAFCPSYSCEPLKNNICLNPSAAEIEVSQCKTGQVCSPLNPQELTYCTPAPLPALSWPGESCKTKGCAFGYCGDEQICVGKAANETCTVNDECDPGLYCEDGICEYLIPYGFGPCSSDFECASSAGCLNGICVEYYSKEEAEIVDCVNNQSNFCDSGACYKDYCLGSFKNDKGEGSECKTNADCVSSQYSMPIYPVLFYSECSCGYNGKSYCELFPGDGTMKTYLYYLIDWVKSNNMQRCNTMRRFSQGCISSHWGSTKFSTFMYYQLLTTNYSRLITGSSCILESLNQDFFSYETRLKAHSISLLFSSIFLILN